MRLWRRFRRGCRGNRGLQTRLQRGPSRTERSSWRPECGGLGNTDIGSKLSIGGLSREFYRRVGAHYRTEEEWCFEPHVAEAVFDSWLQETNVRVFKRQFVKAVHKENGRLVALQTVSGLTIEADMFIDASYEGDLMALAGCLLHGRPRIKRAVRRNL